MNDQKNVYYYFYRLAGNEEDQYIGFLKEKRKKLERITCNSIMNYAKKFDVKELYEDRVYFVPVELYSGD